MNLLDAFAPHILYLAGLIVCFVFIGFLLKHCLSCSLLLLSFIGVWLCYTSLFFLLVSVLPLNGLLRAKPTDNWKSEVKGVGLAIILGFGYEERGDMKPGKANEELLDWTIANTQATTILVQEGVWVAACNRTAATCTRSGRQIRRIHEHSSEMYLNTLDTAFCAMQVMENLGEKEAVLITHDLQLQRAVWDFKAVKQTRGNWQDFRFVVPEMPDISYPVDSVHRQTRCEWAWKIVELFVSRPRDFLSPIPDKCRAPLP